MCPAITRPGRRRTRAIQPAPGRRPTPPPRRRGVRPRDPRRRGPRDSQLRSRAPAGRWPCPAAITGTGTRLASDCCAQRLANLAPRTLRLRHAALRSDVPPHRPVQPSPTQSARRLAAAGGQPDRECTPATTGILLKAINYPQAEKAADWEFTYYRQGVLTQVLNRNVLANSTHAYALYWSTPQSEWAQNFHIFETFAQTFQPAHP